MKRWLDMRELGTIIASLKLWQRTEETSPVLLDIASGGESYRPLDNDEVEMLVTQLSEATHPSLQPVLGDSESQDAIYFVRTLAEQPLPVPGSRAEKRLNEVIEGARAIYDKHHEPPKVG